MSDFKLEPWEVPSGDVSACAGKADVEIEVGSGSTRHELMLRVVRFKDAYCTFARAKHPALVGNYLLVERRDIEHRHHSSSVWNVAWKPPLETVAQSLEEQKVELARFCVLADGKQTRRAFTLSSGESSWLSAGMWNQELFDILMEKDTFSQKPHAHFELLQQEVARPDSDARFAANWLRWSARKKQESIFGKQQLRALEHLMRCVLWSDVELWNRSDRWVWDLYQRGVHFGLVYSPTAYIFDVQSQVPRFVQLAHLLVQKWPRQIGEADLRKHRCVRRYHDGNFFWPNVDVDTPPTQHERLEARLHLRDWLQQNAPDRMDLLPD